MRPGTTAPRPGAGGWLERVRRTPLVRRLDGGAAPVVVSAAALAASWATARRTRGTIPRWELRSFTALNRLPEGLRPGVWPVMQLGNFWMWAAAVPAGHAVARNRRTPAAWAGSVVLAWGSAKAVKDVVGRGRPIEFDPGTAVRERGITGLGFVSGHTAIAFALATAVRPYLPPGARAAAYVPASVVGLCRIYVGAHLPLDVVGGAALGVLCGTATSLAAGVPVAGIPAPPREILEMPPLVSRSHPGGATPATTSPAPRPPRRASSDGSDA